MGWIGAVVCCGLAGVPLFFHGMPRLPQKCESRGCIPRLSSTTSKFTLTRATYHQFLARSIFRALLAVKSRC